MNENNINIAIAESMGWSLADRKYLPWTAPDKERHQDVISYTSDLNAMHEVIMSNTENEFSTGILDQILWESYEPKHLVSHFDRLQATAEQLAEAYLKTIGKWKEGE
jgi:hypothetical protein